MPARVSIPFHVPYLTGRELDYVSQVIQSRRIESDGPFTKRCTELLRRKLTDTAVYLTPSCTDALEMSAWMLGLGPGDEVILPSFTFVSTANAFLLGGATPIFADIREDTLNLDEQLIEQHITPRTRAIVPVHYGGVACEMDTICKIARKHGLFVVEDAAQGFNAHYRGAPLGTLGDLGAFSFHSTKDTICGEGGALAVSSPSLSEVAELVREKGTNRAKFLRGESERYEWVTPGSSFIPSELNCAFLLAQLESVDWIRERKRAAHERYTELLAPLHSNGLLRLPSIPPHCESNYHTFYVTLVDANRRDPLIQFLKARGIEASFHFLPLHRSPMGERLGYGRQSLPVTEQAAASLLRLPFFVEISEAQQATVVSALEEFFLNETVRSSYSPVAAPLS